MTWFDAFSHWPASNQLIFSIITVLVSAVMMFLLGFGFLQFIHYIAVWRWGWPPRKPIEQQTLHDKAQDGINDSLSYEIVMPRVPAKRIESDALSEKHAILKTMLELKTAENMAAMLNGSEAVKPVEEKPPEPNPEPPLTQPANPMPKLKPLHLPPLRRK